jgi:K+-sensing histidine kinase KdpD
METLSDSAPSVILGVSDATALREAEQLKDDFLALVSHELRTPLSAIHGGASVLLRRPNLELEARNELLQDVVMESERLERLLSNLLTLIDITSGRIQPSLEPVMLRLVVKQAVLDVSPRAHDHQFEIDIPDDLPLCEADPGLLEGVLRNLYENAVKYAPQGGPGSDNGGAEREERRR